MKCEPVYSSVCDAGGFSWDEYLAENGGVRAPQRCFKQVTSELIENTSFLLHKEAQKTEL